MARKNKQIAQTPLARADSAQVTELPDNLAGPEPTQQAGEAVPVQSAEPPAQVQQAAEPPTEPAIDPIDAAIADREAEYEALRQQAAAFDRETIQLRRQWEAELKQKIEDRKRQLKDLLARKQAAFVAFEQAKARKNAPPAPRRQWGVTKTETITG